LAPEGGSTVPSAVRYRFDPGEEALRRGVDPLGVLDEFREIGATAFVGDVSGIPALDQIDAGTCYLSWTVDFPVDVSLEQIREAALLVGADSVVLVDAPVAAEEGVSPARAAIGPAVRTRGGQNLTGRVRVDAESLDQLIGLAGELAVISDNLQSLLGQPWAERWTNAIESLDQVGRQLRDAALEMRMVPIDDLFARIPRLVRDLGERSGKQVSLTFEGEETQIDRAIIERLMEPLVHLIRNAVDHGLESPEERARSGHGERGRAGRARPDRSSWRPGTRGRRRVAAIGAVVDAAFGEARGGRGRSAARARADGCAASFGRPRLGDGFLFRRDDSGRWRGRACARSRRGCA
jgi:two-component system chemotaxis sensor kinase CheA